MRMDVRAVLFLVLCATVVSYLVPNLLVHAALTAVLLVLSGVYGRMAPAVRLLAGYAIGVAWLLVDVHFGIIIPPPMTLALVYKSIPVLLAARLLFAVPSAKLTAGIRQLPIPASVQLMLTVMLRFIPTVASETTEVRDAMRVRGLWTRRWRFSRTRSVLSSTPLCPSSSAS
ncbi:energy-coupling factor transporter transmembrane component T [uncultured Propionibacterium sp.]|uniref:energy-coupling factor transporter transmembrane component T n=1 Tax=uncultured Propionibacterium sp. TaxID=218066 RepID=UPI0029306E9E|nr:energy-coupling factor transporter transmembrane component T [uncultured Propionibacterium sp.]